MMPSTDDALEATPGEARAVAKRQLDLGRLGACPESPHDSLALFEQCEPDPIVWNQGKEVLVNLIQDFVDEQAFIDPLRDFRQHGGLFGLRLQGRSQRKQSLPELRHFVSISNRDIDVELSLSKCFRRLAVKRYSGVVQASSVGGPCGIPASKILAQSGAAGSSGTNTGCLLSRTKLTMNPYIYLPETV